ncbi:hypothetical protein PGB90_007505 [Kerria lacca]
MEVNIIRVSNFEAHETKWTAPGISVIGTRSESANRLKGTADSFLRTLKRHSLRVRRSRSLAVTEKRKSDWFVNSQEWTLSRSVPDLRIGIVGSLSSGKSALVHRYLTGSYMQEESPEGGRFKKEIIIDGQSHLLLIRDEGGLPELQKDMVSAFEKSEETKVNYRKIGKKLVKEDTYIMQTNSGR